MMLGRWRRVDAALLIRHLLVATACRRRLQPAHRLSRGRVPRRRPGGAGAAHQHAGDGADLAGAAATLAAVAAGLGGAAICRIDPRPGVIPARRCQPDCWCSRPRGHLVSAGDVDVSVTDVAAVQMESSRRTASRREVRSVLCRRRQSRCGRTAASGSASPGRSTGRRRPAAARIWRCRSAVRRSAPALR